MARRILVVDDDPAIRKVLTQTLELEGYGVTIAEDGERAVNSLEAQRPDLVILDVMMPKMTGYDVLKWIRDNASTKDLPVILLTAKSRSEDVWEGWSKGADYYMTKPFDVEDLLTYIGHVFDKTPS